MVRTSRFCAVMVPFAVLALFPGNARADLHLDLSSVINGATPIGSTPWLTADFHTNGVGDVTLTMNNLMPSYEFVDTWMFNVDVHVPLDATRVSGVGFMLQQDPTRDMNGGNNMKAGLFNLMFSFPTANNLPRFIGGTTVVVEFKGDSITADSFNLMSLPDPHGFETDVTAADIQGIPGSLSGSIRGTVAAVPEVSSVFLLLGVAALMAPALRKKLS